MARYVEIAFKYSIFIFCCLHLRELSVELGSFADGIKDPRRNVILRTSQNRKRDTTYKLMQVHQFYPVSMHSYKGVRYIQKTNYSSKGVIYVFIGH